MWLDSTKPYGRWWFLLRRTPTYCPTTEISKMFSFIWSFHTQVTEKISVKRSVSINLCLYLMCSKKKVLTRNIKLSQFKKNQFKWILTFCEHKKLICELKILVFWKEIVHVNKDSELWRIMTICWYFLCVKQKHKWQIWLFDHLR